jgi:hypothetical protein
MKKITTWKKITQKDNFKINFNGGGRNNKNLNMAPGTVKWQTLINRQIGLGFP